MANKVFGRHLKQGVKNRAATIGPAGCETEWPAIECDVWHTKFAGELCLMRNFVIAGKKTDRSKGAQVLRRFRYGEEAARYACSLEFSEITLGNIANHAATS